MKAMTWSTSFLRSEGQLFTVPCMVCERISRVRVLLLVISALLLGCTSLHKIDISEDQLHEQIRAGEILREGDRVQIITFDKKRHEIWVTGIDEALVYGEKAVRGDREVRGQRKVERESVSVAIDDIVGIKTRDFSVGKTTVLSVGLYYLIIAIGTAMVVGGM
jgi:hypothetical protein